MARQLQCFLCIGIFSLVGALVFAPNISAQTADKAKQKTATKRKGGKVVLEVLVGDRVSDARRFESMQL